VRFDKLFFWLLILFLPTQLGRHFWPDFSFVSGVRVDFLSPTIFFTDLLILATLISFLFQKRPRIKSLVAYWPVLAVFFYLFLVSLLAKVPPLSFLKLLKVIELFLLGFYIFDQKPFLQVAKPLSLALFGESLIGLGQFFKGASLGGPFWWLGERTFSVSSINIALGELGGRVFLRPYGTFSHPNSLAGFFLVCLFIVLRDRKLSLWWKSLVGALGFCLLVISFSQVAWLAAGAAFFFLVFKKIKPAGWLLPAFFLICFLAATFGLFFLKIDKVEFQERVWLAKAAVAMIGQSPFFGVGLSGFIPALPRFWQAKIFLLQPVHNLFLLAGAEAGLLGLALFFLFWFALFKKAQKDKFLFLAVMSIFLTGLFDHYWFTLQQNMLLLTLVVFSVWSLGERV